MAGVAHEVNFDGLVGPTHHYGGLSFGNVASTSNRDLSSNPREAALQGLRKMRFLMSLGLRQGVLPPQRRPDLEALRRLGFFGDDAQVVAAAAKNAPELLSACYSASNMWTANAATVSPSADTEDGKVHFTAANLASKFHRSLEPEPTSRALRAIFANPSRFSHHEPLPGGVNLGDEGAANHTRLCERHGEGGLEIFVYGRHGFLPGRPAPTRYPARQCYEASLAIARLHRLPASRVLLLQQNPVAIDAGVFHNDVVAVGNRNFFLCHEKAFLEQPAALAALRESYRVATGGRALSVFQVAEAEVGLADAVTSYLFNSQIVTLPGGKDMALIAPVEARENPAVSAFLERLVRERLSPISEIHYFDLRQSMRNGGGPACLRLRVVLTDAELAAAHPGVFVTEPLLAKLEAWVRRHYRDRLAPADLADPRLLDESRVALDELTGLLF